MPRSPVLGDGGGMGVGVERTREPENWVIGFGDVNVTM